MATWLTCTDIAVIKLFPNMLSFYFQHDRLWNKTNCFRADIMAVVHIINSMTSLSESYVLLRSITLKCLAMNIAIICQHVKFSSYILCGSLSRIEQDKFRLNAPDASVYPADCIQSVVSSLLKASMATDTYSSYAKACLKVVSNRVQFVTSGAFSGI